MSLNIGHALLGAAEGFLQGGPVGAAIGGVAGGFEPTTAGATNGTAGLSGLLPPMGGASDGNELGSILSLFGGADSIEKSIGQADPATLEKALALFG